ncbi:hypothetical protein ACIGEP_07125 [Microbacterium sp. NPDC077663]
MESRYKVSAAEPVPHTTGIDRVALQALPGAGTAEVCDVDGTCR